MILVPLRLCLRGERNYLHGTDLYLAMLNATVTAFESEQISEIRMRFPRPFTEPLQLELSDFSNDTKSPEWSCVVGGKKRVGRLIPLDHQPPLKRFSFDESKLDSVSKIEGTTASLLGECGYSPIEYIVFLTKQLHQKTLPANKGSQWVFSRLELMHNPAAPEMERMKISLIPALNDQFSRSEIMSNGMKIGDIFFSKIVRHEKG